MEQSTITDPVTAPAPPTELAASADRGRAVAPWRQMAPGLALTAGGVAVAMLAHEVLDDVGVLTWAVLLGAVAANLNLVPAAAEHGLRVATRRLLRTGVVLLGFSLSITSILDLGPQVIVLVAATLASTFLLTNWLGNRLGVASSRSLLIATGFAICGASAIAAMESNADGDDDDVATAIAMVTLCGTLAMILVPALQSAFGLDDRQLGAWAGASVHEVGQVVGAAASVGAAATSIAIVVKLTRVLFLAPTVALVGLRRRRRMMRSSDVTAEQLPPLMPLFVAGFLVCCLIRSSGAIPSAGIDLIGDVQVAVLAAALFAMGTGVRLRSVILASGRPLVVSAISTVAISAISLTGVLILV